MGENFQINSEKLSRSNERKLSAWYITEGALQIKKEDCCRSKLRNLAEKEEQNQGAFLIKRGDSQIKRRSVAGYEMKKEELCRTRN